MTKSNKKYRIDFFSYENKNVANFISIHGSVFHQYCFLNAVGNEYRCYVIINIQSQEIIAVMPLVKSKKNGLNSYHIPPFCYLFGPLLHPLNLKEEQEIIRMFYNEIKHQKQIDFKAIIENGNILPYKALNYSIEANQGHIFKSERQFNIKVLDKDKKRDLKKLQKLIEDKTISIVENSELNFKHILNLWNETAQRVKFNSHSKVLHRIINSSVKLYTNVIFDNQGNPIAGCICPYDKKTMFHLVGTSTRTENKLLSRANILSLYTAVSYANKKGLNFDFEGSNLTGVADFYRSMGGEPILVHRVQKTKSIYFNFLKIGKKIQKEIFE